jgi:hypothetical protein
MRKWVRSALNSSNRRAEVTLLASASASRSVLRRRHNSNSSISGMSGMLPPRENIPPDEHCLTAENGPGPNTNGCRSATNSRTRPSSCAQCPDVSLTASRLNGQPAVQADMDEKRRSNALHSENTNPAKPTNRSSAKAVSTSALRSFTPTSYRPYFIMRQSTTRFNSLQRLLEFRNPACSFSSFWFSQDCRDIDGN